MKKKLAALLLVVAFQSYGQDKRLMFGFNASVDWNSYLLIEDLGISDLQGTLNYASGVTVRKYLSSRLSLAGSINYAVRNFKQHMDYSKLDVADPHDPAYTDNPTYTHNHGFIDIPVCVAYSIVHTARLEILPSVGIVNSFLVHFEQEANMRTPFVDEGLQYNHHLLATQAGFGFLIKQEHFGILLEPQARIYVSQVHHRGPEQNPFQLGLSASFLWWK
jgi:hypothetical protein